MISVSLIRCKNEALKNCTVLQRSKNIQVTGLAILIFPIDCCVRINHRSDGLFNGDIQSYLDSDHRNVKSFVFLATY